VSFKSERQTKTLRYGCRKALVKVATIIEPEKRNLDNLLECIKTNTLNNVSIVPKAAWDEQGHHTLLLSEESLDHRLLDESI
jgi:hypothetical protein